jgi:hypothetical protein
MTDVLTTENSTEVLVTENGTIEILTEGEQGPEGPPYPTMQGNFLFNIPTNSTKPLISYALYAFTIDQLFYLKTASGTCTISIQINDVAITGLDAIAVTTTAQNPIATALNSVVVGDRVTIVISNVSGATVLEFSAEGTLS